MGAPGAGMQAAEENSAEALLSAFKTIDPAERRRHASVLNYWLSIRGDKEFPPLHDLDPLEISDAGPQSVLLELISGGHDAEVRHIGEALRDEGRPERIIDAATPSILASIAKKLPIVAISRDFLAFEDEFRTPERSTRCWVTLLPLSAGGAWVDYVYGLVSVETGSSGAAETAKPPAKSKARNPAKDEVQEQAAEPEAAPSEIEEPAAAAAPDAQPDEPIELDPEEPVEPIAAEPQAEEPAAAMELDEPIVDEVVAEPAPSEEIAEAAEDMPVALDAPGDEAPADEPAGKSRPGFSKLLDNLAGLTGFYGHGYKVDPEISASAAEPEGAPDDAAADAASAAEPEPARDAIAEASPDEASTAAPDERAEPAATEPATAEEPVAAMELDEPIVDEVVAEPAPSEEIAEAAEDMPVALDAPDDEAPADEPAGKSRPGFSKLLDNLAGLTGFYGHGYKVDPEISASAAEPEGAPDDAPAEPESAGDAIAEASPDEASTAAPDERAEPAATEPAAAEEPVAEEAVTPPPAEEAVIEPSADQPAPAMEGLLQTKLADVRAKADEARQAKLRANAALYEGLSAAYDFALDAEDAPEEYLRLVEGAGLKIQLRAPMRPVVKLAFNGLCDDATIGQLEAVLAWALDNELPRGSLIERIEAAGGIAPILQGEAKAA